MPKPQQVVPYGDEFGAGEEADSEEAALLSEDRPMEAPVVPVCAKLGLAAAGVTLMLLGFHFVTLSVASQTNESVKENVSFYMYTHVQEGMENQTHKREKENVETHIEIHDLVGKENQTHKKGKDVGTHIETNAQKGKENVETHTALDFCYVHIGKSGGLTMVGAMRTLQRSHVIRNFVQVHSRGKASQPPKPGNVYNKTSLKDNQYYDVCGPLANEICTTWCADTGNILIWVRDPVARLISTWNFKSHSSNEHVLEAAREVGVATPKQKRVSLNHIADNIANRADPEDKKMQDLFTVLEHVEHANRGIAFYLGDALWAANRYSEMNSPCNKTLDKVSPFVQFVGRTEYMTEDWEAFLEQTAARQHQPKHETKLGHAHASEMEGEALSTASVKLIRQYYGADYQCLLSMVGRGLISQDYYDEITLNTREYKSR